LITIWAGRFIDINRVETLLYFSSQEKHSKIERSIS
jgi:hypothetical protein